MADEKTRANGNNIMLREKRRGRNYDINEESKALELPNNEVRMMNLPSHAFEGLLIAAKYPIILPEEGGYGRGSTCLFLISSSTHSYRPTIVSWADITVSLLVRGVVGVMTR